MPSVKTTTMLILTLALSACARYQFFVNEQLIYSPPPLFSDFALKDEQLQDCIVQTIADEGISEAGQLSQLNCSHAGIDSLLGLSQFSGLESINFSDNSIQDLTPLSKIPTIATLHLANNKIHNAHPLLELKQLKNLILTGNKNLACAISKTFDKRTDLEVTLPKHCSETKVPGNQQ